MVYLDKPDTPSPTITNDFQQVLYDLFVAIIVCWVFLLLGGLCYWVYKEHKKGQAPPVAVEQKGNKLEDLVANQED